jgi:uncharacterized protein YceK
MKKLIAMLAVVAMLSGCSVMEKLINPPIQSTTPQKTGKICRRSADPGFVATGFLACCILMLGAIGVCCCGKG